MSHNIVSGPPVASFSGSVDPLTEDVDNSSTPRGSSQPIPIAGGAKKHRGLQVCHVCRTHLPHTYLMPLFGGARAFPALLKCAPPGGPRRGCEGFLAQTSRASRSKPAQAEACLTPSRSDRPATRLISSPTFSSSLQSLQTRPWGALARPSRHSKRSPPSPISAGAAGPARTSPPGVAAPAQATTSGQPWTARPVSSVTCGGIAQVGADEQPGGSAGSRGGRAPAASGGGSARAREGRPACRGRRPRRSASGGPCERAAGVTSRPASEPCERVAGRRRGGGARLWARRRAGAAPRRARCRARGAREWTRSTF